MRYVLPVVSVGAAYLVTLAAEHLFDLGVVAALVIALAALWRTGTSACPGRRDRLSSIWLAAAMPLLGSSHADPQWWRTSVALYAAYALLALVILRRKSTPLGKR